MEERKGIGFWMEHVLPSDAACVAISLSQRKGIEFRMRAGAHAHANALSSALSHLRTVQKGELARMSIACGGFACCQHHLLHLCLGFRV